MEFPLPISADDSIAIVESHGFMAAARLVQLLAQETRVRVIAVSPMNASGAITTVIAGALADVQYALQLARSENAMSDSTFFARPHLETIEMLIRSALGTTAIPVRKPAKQPDPLPLFEQTSEEVKRQVRSEYAGQPATSRQRVHPSTNGAAQDIQGKPLYELEGLSVHELRRYARSIPNFPIQGREISRANRGDLLQLIKSLEEQSRTRAARSAADGSIDATHKELLQNEITSN